MRNKDPETMSDGELLGEEALNASKKVFSMAGRGARMSWKLFLGLLVAAIVFVAIGIALGNNKITALGNIFKIIALGGVAFVFAALLYPFLGGRYLRAVVVCVSTQLAITAFMVFFKEMPMTLTAYSLMNLGSAALCLALWAASPHLVLTGGIIILLSIGTMLFPEPVRRFERGIVGLNVNEPAQFARGSISSGKIYFFGGKNGKEPLYFYSFEKGKYVLFKVDGYDSLSGDKLMPVTRELAFRLRENEDLVSPRNFISQIASGTTPAPVAQNPYGAPPVPLPEPPPAPAPYIPSSPPVPEPAPLPASPEESAPSSGYRPEAPERAIEEAPIPRYKYATLFVGDAGPDANYSQQIASWFEDGTSAAEIFQIHALSSGGKLTDTGRRQLRSLAENIVIIQCSTRPTPSGSRDRHYTCELEANVISTRTGAILKTFRRSQGASGFTDHSARQSAITLALAIAKNNLP